MAVNHVSLLGFLIPDSTKHGSNLRSAPRHLTRVCQSSQVQGALLNVSQLQITEHEKRNGWLKSWLYVGMSSFVILLSHAIDACCVLKRKLTGCQHGIQGPQNWPGFSLPLHHISPSIRLEFLSCPLPAPTLWTALASLSG